MNWLDFIGASLSLICTYYSTQAHRLTWVFGIIATITNGLLYWQKGIYGASMVEGIYFFTMIYGWYQWSYHHTPQKSHRAITQLSLQQGVFYALIALLGIVTTAHVLTHWTDSDIPYWDATTTILSLMAQWFLCLKIMHCWALWFAVNMLCALLQWYKGIPFHSMMYWIYVIMAVVGHYRWQSLYRRQIS